MIERVMPSTRKLLVECRCLAMRDGSENSIAKLDEAVDRLASGDARLDRIALHLLKAELLYLDNKAEKSLEVFRDKIDSELHDLPDEIRLIIGDNRNLIGTWHEPEHPRRFYLGFDERRLAGVRILDSNALLAATRSAEEGKHFESLPAVWRELRRAYLKASWRGSWVISKHMAKECLDLGWPHEAAYHAMLSMDSEFGERIGKHLLACRDLHLIKLTIDKIFASASLRRHAVVACSLIHALGDAIPQERLGDLLEWLLPWSREQRAGLADCTLMEKAWMALGSIAPQLNTIQAHQVATAAVSHPLWRTVHIDRRHIIPVLNRCVTHLDPTELPEFASQALPLVTNLKSDVDYVEAINLVCHMAALGGEKVKSMIAEAVIPEGIEVSNSVLIRVAPALGRRIADANRLARMADKVATEIRLLVQRVKPGESPTRVSGAVGMVTKPVGEQKLVVHIGVNAHALAALSGLRDILADCAIQSLVESMLAMLVERENVLSNKAELMLALADFADRLSDGLHQKVLDTIGPFAEGNIIEPTVVMTSQELKEPLNPFRMHYGEPAQVRGTAIYTLACIEKAKPGVYGKRFNSILEPALSDMDPEIRRFAFAAAREAPRLSSPSFMALLMGTRDPDPKAAAAALYAIGASKNLKLTKSRWDLLLYGIRMARESPDAELRRAGALVISNMRQQATLPKDQRIAELAKGFAEDICFSVRNTLAESSGDN